MPLLGKCKNCNKTGQYIVNTSRNYYSCDDCVNIVREIAINKDLDEGILGVAYYELGDHKYRISTDHKDNRYIIGNVAKPILYYRSYIQVIDSSIYIRINYTVDNDYYYNMVDIIELGKLNYVVPCPKLVTCDDKFKKELEYIQDHIIKASISNNRLLQLIKKYYHISNLRILPFDIIEKVLYSYYDVDY
jgi:hypothetical protein